MGLYLTNAYYIFRAGLYYYILIKIAVGEHFNIPVIKNFIPNMRVGLNINFN